MDSDKYLLTCMRYVELNPVRAAMVAHPGDYKWSSHGADAQDRADPLLTPHGSYLSLGENMATHRHAYRELFRHHLGDEQLHEIRDALNHELVLGRSYFKDRIEVVTRR